MRLIDADKLKSIIDSEEKWVLELIDEEPTAYDVENVMANLEKGSYEILLDDGSLVERSHSVIDTNIAINIVRNESKERIKQ